MGNVAKTAGVALAGIGAVGAAGFGALAAAGIKANASLEQTKVAFTTLLGSAEAAGGFLKDLSAFAASTPFEFPELAQAGQKLLAFGFEAKNIIPLMTSIGDSVGALGGSAADVDRVTMALGQMQAKGKASNEELLQMAELGLPVYDILAKGFNTTTANIQDMVSKGVIPADKAIQMLAEGFEQRFGGSMAQQSQTFNGLLSTLQDNARLALQAFTGPLFEQAKGGLETLGNLVASPAFQQFAADMGEKVGGAIATVVNWLTPLVQGFYQIGSAILSSEDPIATILDLLDSLIPGFADAAASAYSWGANIVSQLAAGMGAAVDAVISVINTIASIIAYWFAPGSPPRVAPNIDEWGEKAAGEFFGGMANADTSPIAGMTKPIADAFNDLSGQVNSALQNMVDLGALDKLQRIPALQGFRQQIAGALEEMDQFGSVSDATWQNVQRSLGPVAGSMTPVVRAYLDMASAQQKVSRAQTDLDTITKRYSKQLDDLQSQLKSTQRLYDQQLRPFNDQLKALDNQEDAIKRVQRAQEAQKTLKDSGATKEEKALAQLELQRIALEDQMAPIEQARDAAVQSIQDQIDATEAQRDAEVSAAQTVLDTYQAQLSAAQTIYQNEQARVGVIQSSNSLLAEQAKLIEQAAKAGAGGGGKGGGGGGLKLPGGAGGLGKGLDLSKIMPDDAKGKLADIGKLFDDVKEKINAAKETLAGWREKFDGAFGSLGSVTQAWNGFKSTLDTIAPVLAGIAAGLAAFAVLNTVAGWVGGLIAAWSGLSAAFAAGEGIAGVVALLGGPLTIALAALAAAVGLLVAAWVTNFGGIRDAVDQAWAKMQPVFSQLIDWLGAQIPVVIAAAAAFWTNVLQPALLLVAEFVANVVIPAIADAVVWLGTNIPAAIQAASDFWTGTLQPALQTVSDFVQNTLIPAFTTVVTWLGTNIPAASQTMSDVWTGTLQPALNAVWSFIQNNIIPILAALGNVEIAAVNLAVRTMAGVWTDTLQPALNAVWSFIQNNIVPIFRALGNVEIAAVKLAVQELADLWTKTLQPALNTVWGFINTNILPVFDAISSKITSLVTPAFDGLSTKIGGVGSALSTLKGIVDSAVSWLNNLANKIDQVNSKPKPSGYGAGGGSDGSYGGSSGGSNARSLVGMRQAARALTLPLDGITQSMQDLALKMTFVADRERQLATNKALSDKFKALQGDAKTTAEYYAQLGQNVKFLADAMTTYKQVEIKDSKGKGTGNYESQLDQLKLTESQLTAFQAEFSKAQQQMAQDQAQYGQQYAEQRYAVVSKYLQDEANLQIELNNATTDAQKAAILEQMNLRYKQQQAELAAIDETKTAQLDAIAEQQAAADKAYQDAMQHIQDIFNAQRKANLQGSADLYSLFSDTAGQLADMLSSAYDDAYNKALDGAKLPDPGTLSNAELEKAYADYQAKVDAAQAAGQTAQQQVQAVQQQLLDLQQQALQIAQIDPQAAADFYDMEQKYVLQVADLQDKIANATSDQQKAALQQQLDYLQQSHQYQEQLFQANLDQYGQNLSDAQQAAQDAAAQTGDSALQTYAQQLAQMFTLFQQQLSGAVAGATMTALQLPPAAMPNLTQRGIVGGGGAVTTGDIHITVNGANVKDDRQLARLIGDELDKRLQASAQSADRLGRNSGKKRF